MSDIVDAGRKSYSQKRSGFYLPTLVIAREGEGMFEGSSLPTARVILGMDGSL